MTTVIQSTPDTESLPPAARATRTSRPKSGFRPEIQALRAVAVLIVVVYHLWPKTLTGGFIGVDVFFVISGFLITAHLLKEADRTGRISLPQFWAKRIRRLLPASLTVLGASAVGVFLLVPQMYWGQFLKEIAASAVYAQNWVLAADSIDYLKAENIASPVQHFWSLSVEEQFYLVWPILIGLVFLITRRLSGRAQIASVAIALSAVAGASFAFSVGYTVSNPGEAYFATTTRAWEFALGGLLAVVGTATLRTPNTLRVLVSYAGWAGIAVAVVTFSGATQFPGSAALLPVIATLAVIWAGAPESKFSPNVLMGTSGIQWLGGISYSVYLWHWPLIVFAGFVFADFHDRAKGAVIVIAIVLAWATTKYIENPARGWKPLVSRRPRWTAIAMVAAMLVIAVPAASGAQHMTTEAAAESLRAEAAATNGDPCFGASALVVDANLCADGFDVLTPRAAFASEDEPEVYTNGCYTDLTTTALNTCVVGDTASDINIALIGDSHAASWYPAMKAAAEESGWALSPYMKSSCPMSANVKHDDVPGVQASCADWNADLAAELAAAAEPLDLVVLSHSSTGDKYGSDKAAIEGFQTAWAPLIERGTQVVVIQDIPQMSEDTNLCISKTSGENGACDRLERDAVHTDLMVMAAAGQKGVTVIDMNDFFCQKGLCSPVIGGVVAYRDSHHITETYAKTLAPYLSKRITDAVPEILLP